MLQKATLMEQEPAAAVPLRAAMDDLEKDVGLVAPAESSLASPPAHAFASDVQARFAALFWAALEACRRAAADSFFAADVAEVAEVPLVSVEESEEACALAANLS